MQFRTASFTGTTRSSLMSGILQTRVFTIPFPVGFGYIFNLNDKYGWEVARAQYIIAPENDLKSKLEIAVWGYTF